MKTIKEWLNELPEDIKVRAIKNTEDDILNAPALSLEVVICGAFQWYGTPEGVEFWAGVRDKAIAGEYKGASHE
jgi:hypothetical protein